MKRKIDGFVLYRTNIGNLSSRLRALKEATRGRSGTGETLARQGRRFLPIAFSGPPRTRTQHGLAMATLYQMLGQAVRSEDPKVMLARIQDFERTFEQRYGRKMTDYELSMLKTAREIVDRELRAENSEKKAA